MHLYILVIALFSGFYSVESAPEHAFYISVIEINHTAQATDAAMTIKVFTDDLADAMRNALNLDEPIDTRILCEDYKGELSDYFAAHMSITLNGEDMAIHYGSCESVGDTYQFSFSIDCPSEWHSLEISADFLMELFPTQSQMVHITNNSKTTTARITAKRKSQTINF